VESLEIAGPRLEGLGIDTGRHQARDADEIAADEPRNARKVLRRRDDRDLRCCREGEEKEEADEEECSSYPLPACGGGPGRGDTPVKGFIATLYSVPHLPTLLRKRGGFIWAPAIQRDATHTLFGIRQWTAFSPPSSGPSWQSMAMLARP
jgi:hypothetical protein